MSAARFNYEDIADAGGALYRGEVVHMRLRPTPHKLRYNVFSLLLDIDRLAETLQSTRLLSYNRFNLFSVYDRDHGPGDGTTMAVHARQLLANAGIDFGSGRIWLLAYPRVLGGVFNPLSVYYACHSDGRLAGLIYEVNNTFGERHSYVIPAGDGHHGIYAQSSAKLMCVSPFTAPAGHYGFRVTQPQSNLVVGVQFHDQVGALIRTHFKGVAFPLTSRGLAAVSIGYPLMTAKVIGGIHYEAFKIWLKGVPLVKRKKSPRYAISTPVPETRPP